MPKPAETITTDPLIEIRTFSSLIEIEALPGFKKENPISVENYNYIIGDYLLDSEVKCCLLKENSKLCGEKHKWGFVARLKDDSITLVGNDCANTKFNGETRLSADRSKYQNEKRRQERLARLTELLARKDQALKETEEIKASINSVKERVQALSSKLGPHTMRQLEEMARTKVSKVTVTGVTLKEYVDKKGKTKIERRTALSSLGNIADTTFLLDSNYRPILLVLLDVKNAYQEAEAISKTVRTSKLTSLNAKMNEIERAKELARLLIDGERSLLESDLSLLCFLSADKNERYKSARFALENLGLESGKEKAKNWLNEKEREICARLNFSKIEIL